MLSFQNFLTVSVLALSAFVAEAAEANDFETPVTADFYDNEIRFTGEFGLVYSYRWYPVMTDGRGAICGAGHFRDTGFRSTVRDMAREATFYLDDQEFSVDVSHFARVRHARDLDTATARCRVTAVPAFNSGRIYLQFGRGMYRN